MTPRKVKPIESNNITQDKTKYRKVELRFLKLSYLIFLVLFSSNNKI